MSEYPDIKRHEWPAFNEPKPTQPRLPEPKPGHKWELVRQVHDELQYKQRPIRKLYDWSKTGPNVLVVDSDTVESFMRRAPNPLRLVQGAWQAHIGGGPCPVDPDATMVEIQDYESLKSTTVCVAGEVFWDKFHVIYRVTGLVEGYSYDG